MAVLTGLMFVALLCLAPLRVAAEFRVDFSRKCLFARVKLFGICFFSERFSVENFKLICRGTIDADIDILTMDGSSGVLLKALTFDSVSIFFAPNYGLYSPFSMVASESACFVAGTLGCACSHCKVNIRTGFSAENCLFGNIVVSVTVAEALIVGTSSRRVKKAQNE